MAEFIKQILWWGAGSIPHNPDFNKGNQKLKSPTLLWIMTIYVKSKTIFEKFYDSHK